MQTPEDFIAALVASLGEDANVTVRRIPLEELFGDAALFGAGAASVGYAATDADAVADVATATDVGEVVTDTPDEEEEGPCGCFLQGEIQGYAKALAFHSHGVRWEFLDFDEQTFLLDQAAGHLNLI